MTRYRALVVDDSNTARQSLAKLLERHDLAVDFAVSGEEALEFLKGQLVDVIFMDHSMPGMTGLEAVSAIKGNPRTATIPVMMYTTKEGEVYVSQARALGAIGVLPKQVQPGVLFDMLNKLGLVNDRRDAAGPPQADAPRRRYDDLIDAVDREYEQRALGASVQALLTRILEQQHAQLRADIQGSQRRFARQVAEEILEQRALQGPGSDTASAAPSRAATPVRRMLVIGTLSLALLTLGMWSWQLLDARDAALAQVAHLSDAARHEAATWSERGGTLAATLDAERSEAVIRQAAALQALQWALNQGGRVAVHEAPFNSSVAARLGDLIDHLATMGFQGKVTLTARLGQFCLTRDGDGQWRHADADLPTTACELLGHPLQDAVSADALQTIGFAATVASASADYPDITVELRTASGSETPESYGFDQAGDWNAAAAHANRVEFSIHSSADESYTDLAQRR